VSCVCHFHCLVSAKCGTENSKSNLAEGTLLTGNACRSGRSPAPWSTAPHLGGEAASCHQTHATIFPPGRRQNGVGPTGPDAKEAVVVPTPLPVSTNQSVRSRPVTSRLQKSNPRSL
jgi:hypothetical protein